MMESVLHRLLFDDSSIDSNDAAADALLPLLLSSPNTYQVHACLPAHSPPHAATACFPLQTVL
jgi:hypothetical protein